HMTVFENLAYPLRRAGMEASLVAEKVDATLKLLKAPQLVRRYPGELSGGQQQRIALGRAIINPDNQLILFDEPLSNLDAKLREDLRMEIRGLQEDLGFTAIYVTHDQAEAMSMSDHVVVMRDGRIEREGDPESIFHDPKSRYVAEFFGAHNILPATARATSKGTVIVDTPLGALTAISQSGQLPEPGASLEIVLAVDKIQLSADRSAADAFEATVIGVAYYGNHSDIRIAVGDCQLNCRIPHTQRFKRGQTVFGRTSASALILHC
ncbi:MAG: ABC transporter ATP-binding protein, partial [Proteobacteria bacterium]|nr:ABC transporter ATP-binding protein [Pseudomonadota bacterium]